MAQKLTVNIVGDDTSLQRALKRSQTGVARFGDVAIASAAKQSQALRGVAKAEDDLFRVRARRAASLGPLRLAGIGLGVGTALFAATQATQALGKSLETTGEEAFTTTGRMKNFASSLLSGNIVGAISGAASVAKSLDDIGVSALDAKRGYEDFKRIAKGGGAFADLAQQAVHLVDSTRAAEAAVNALADATARLGTVFVTSTGQAVTFKGAVDDLGGLRGPGLVNQINANLQQAAGGFGQQISPGAKRAAAETIAQARGNLKELLRLQKLDVVDAQRAKNQSRAVGKEYEALNQSLADARAAVITTEGNIKQNAASVAKADAAAKKAGADASKRAAEAAKRAREAAARLAEQRRAAQLAAQQARQLRALEAPTPTIANLRTQLSSLTERLTGTTVDTPKVRAQLARIGKVLSGAFGKATDQTRKSIRDMFQTIRSEFEKGSKDTGERLTNTKTLNVGKIMQGLGLSPSEQAALRRRLGGFTTAGLGFGPMAGTAAFGRVVPGNDVVVNVTTTLDGAVIANSTTRHQQKKARRNPPQKRGPNRSGRLA
jgi:hypothetical protein